MKIEKKYYKYLDLIRIILCLAILLYHLNIIKGGYLAVCSFFTLSGYLTCISALHKEKFSLKDYYFNRLLKIYLPLILVVFITLPFVSLFKDIIWLNLKPEVTSILLGYNNFWQLSVNFDYFAHQIDSPFMHLWYIAILLQFEIVFPFIYLILKKLGDKFNKIIPCLITFLLAAFSYFYFCKINLSGDIMTSYYSTFTRVFSLLFGVLLAFIHGYYGSLIPKTLKDNPYKKIIFCFYILILCCLFVLVPSSTSYLGIIMLVTTLISCRLIDYSIVILENNSSIFDKVIKNLSSISYEIYLWQYPLIFLSQYLNFNFNFELFIMLLILLLLSYWLHFISANYKKLKILKYILSVPMFFVAITGFYQFLLAEDYTVQMKRLEEQLSQNEILMYKKQEEYALKTAQEQKDLEELLQSIDNDESKLNDVITNLSVVGIGDSVMLGATPNLYNKFPNGYFDAKISRTAYVVSDILRDLKNKNSLGDIIILNLGTNGDCSLECKKEILEISDGREIFWVNVTNDNDVNVNSKLSEFAVGYDNLHIVDWNSVSAGHPEYFFADGIHLTEIGKEVYVNTIYESIYNFYLKQYQAKKEEIMNNYEKESKNKISFYGNDILLNAFENIQQTFNDANFYINKDFNYSELKLAIEKSIKEDMLTYKVVFAFDDTLKLSNSEYEDLMNLCQNQQIYILAINKETNDYFSNHHYENVTVIDFYKEIEEHDEFLMPDRIHLTDTGNKALNSLLSDIIK